MWEEELSRDAEKVLGRVVALEREHPGGEVPDLDLFGGDTGLDYDRYEVAAAELIEKGLAKSPGGSDRPSLKATPKGRALFKEL